MEQGRVVHLSRDGSEIAPPCAAGEQGPPRRGRLLVGVVVTEAVGVAEDIITSVWVVVAVVKEGDNGLCEGRGGRGDAGVGRGAWTPAAKDG